MKKIVVGISFILLVMIIMMKTVLAADCKVNLKTAKSELSKNEEFVVEAEISGLNTSKGVAVLMGTIEFDTNSLTLVKIEGQNGWSAPSYNKNNGKFITDKNSNVTKTESVMKITFKVKEMAKQKPEVTIKDMIFSGGAGDIDITKTSKEFTIKNQNVPSKPDTGENDQKPDDNNTIHNDNNINNTTNNNQVANEEAILNVIQNNTAINGNLPQTGEKSYGIFVTIGIIATVLVAAIFFIRMKMIKVK